MMPIFRSLLTKKIFLLFCFVLAMLLFQFSNAEKVQAYAGTYGGTYTNICGSGYVSCPSAGQLITASCNSLEKCTKNCVPDNASCTSPSSGYTYKFTCSGNHRECGGGGANPIKPADKSKSGLSLGTGGYKCNQTIQLDVFSQDCHPNGTWICASGDLIDYMVWYSGACPLATRTPTPTPVSPCVGNSGPSCNVGYTKIGGSQQCTQNSQCGGGTDWCFNGCCFACQPPAVTNTPTTVPACRTQGQTCSGAIGACCSGLNCILGVCKPPNPTQTPGGPTATKTPTPT